MHKPLAAFLVAVVLGSALAACGGTPTEADAGSGGGAGGGGGGGGATGGGAGGGAGDASVSDAGFADSGVTGDAGTDAGSSRDGGGGSGGDGGVVWPFPPGQHCSPTLPASFPGPGLVDPEDLCTRHDDLSGHVALAFGQYGYGSIGYIEGAAKYPDVDFFDVAVTGGEYARVTVAALAGQDFEPSISIQLNGSSILHDASAPPSTPGTATTEFYVPLAALSIDLMVQDKRNGGMPDAGAGAVYSVRVEQISRTPVPLTLPTRETHDFTRQGRLDVYEITLPNQAGSVDVELLSQNRLDGGMPSGVKTLLWLINGSTGAETKEDAFHAGNDSKVQFDFDPTAPATPPGKYLIIADHESLGVRTDYDLVATFDGLPTNDTCGGAIDVTPTGLGVTRSTTGDTHFALNTYALSDTSVSWACATQLNTQVGSRTNSRGRDVVYVAQVPGHQTLTAKVSPAAPQWDPALWLSTDCGVTPETSCVAFVDTVTVSTPEQLTFTNSSGSARALFIHVDAQNVTSFGPFTLETTLTAAPASPANDVCAGAIPLITSGTSQTVTGTTDNATDTVQPTGGALPLVCAETGGAWAGPDVVYSVNVPANKRLVASLTAGPPAWNAALWLSSSCDSAAATCLNAQDDRFDPEAVTWSNTTGVPSTVYVHVDSRDGASSGPFSLKVSLNNGGTVDTCPGSAVSATTNFVANTRLAENDYSFSKSVVATQCKAGISAPWLGRDHVYRYDVPAGQTLSVTVKSTVMVNGHPVDDWAALLSTSCGDLLAIGAGCVDASETGVVTWANSTGATASVYLFVDTVTGAPAQADYNVLPTLQ